MTWDDDQPAKLALLRTILRHSWADLAHAQARLVGYGVPPGEELLAALERTIAATAILGQVVAERLGRLDCRR